MIATDSAPAKHRQSFGRPKDPAKREGIIRAATELFMRQGFTLTSVDAVAKLADVSKLTIYSHFDNKIELFKEVIQQRCDSLAGPDNFMNFAHLPAQTALLQLGGLLATLIYNSDSLHLQRTLYSEAIHHPEIVKIFYAAGPQRVKTAFGELLAEWRRQGQLAVPDIDRATEQFFSLLKGEVYNKAMIFLAPNLSHAELDQHVTATVTAFLAIYRCNTTARAE
jgi:TetR/AcrR family transcriptional repressor of mexJK operon